MLVLKWELTAYVQVYLCIIQYTHWIAANIIQYLLYLVVIVYEYIFVFTLLLFVKMGSAIVSKNYATFP